MEESEHIKGLIEGSYDDFTALYDLYFPKLYGFVFSLIKSHSVTKDIVQETFIKIWIVRKEIQLDQSFQSYIFMIARNKLLNEIRNQTKNKKFYDYMEFSNSLILSNNETKNKLDFDDYYIKIDIAKSKLTPRQREIFELNKESGLAISDIAESLSISEQSVRNQLSISLKILKESINKIQ